MNTPRWTLRALAVCAALVGGATSLAAQGITTGAVSGFVTTEQGTPLDGAQVMVVNTATGARSGTSTRTDGHYYVSSLEVGGPYSITIRHIGYAPHDTAGLNISLGQNLRIDVVMHTQAAVLSAVTATAGAPNAIITSTHMGSATTITDSAITRLPTLGRNFTDFVALTPQVATKGPGTSGGGQNNRFNAIQIDGSVGNDLFGLSSTLQPGGLAGAKQVPLEAVKEYDVLLSPFDVRQGYFSGFLVNAVTKSGSNEFHGSGTYAMRNEKLERNVSYLRSSPFSQKQFGFWVGGPIVKDKVFFSISPEFQRESSPQSGPFIGQVGSDQVPAASQKSIDSVRTILINQYGFADPGNGGAVTNNNPLNNFFGRLDFVNLPHNSRLVTRYNYAGASQDQGLTRSERRLSLSNNGYTIDSKTNSGLAQLFSNFDNGNSNELLVGYTHINDVRATPLQAPFVFITRVQNADGTSTGNLSAGTENSSQGNELEQGIMELSDNFTIPWKNHRFTIGTKNEFYSVRNLFSQNSLGNYTFGDIDSLIANTPSRVTLGEKLDNTDGAARFHARTLGFYVSDVWQASQNLNFTGGLRLDMPGLTDSPGFNPNPGVVSVLGRNTNEVPKNVLQWQPRVGFNWDVTGDQVNQLRGGTGVFMAQPAYVWLSDLFGNSGVNGYGNVSCNNMASSPPMQRAGEPIPGNCLGTAQAPRITVNTVDPDLHFPEVWRSTLGFDRRLPWDVVGTLEGMYTRSVYNFYYQNTGITPDPIGTDRNGRVLYGDISSSSSNVNPTFVSYTDADGNPAKLGDVIDLTNTRTHDYSYSLTAQLQKRFSNSFEGSFAYTYGRAYDVWDLTSSVAFSNWSFGRSYAGRQDAEDLAPSKWDTPHRFVASGTYSFKTHTDISMTMFAESGTPFEYVYGNDMNGDDGTANDLVYVPTDAHDPTQIMFQDNGPFTAAAQADSLESFITSHECLNSQRGTIMKRNSCRTPWTKVVNLSLRQSLPTIQGQNFILQLDVFNFLNLLNSHWGAQDLGSTNSPSLLTRRKWVQPTTGNPLKLADGAQPVFNYNIINQFNTQNASSNYALQLQLKYTF